MVGWPGEMQELCLLALRSLDRGMTHFCANCESVARDRDNARAIARVLAHAYGHDTRPPPCVVEVAMAFPKIDAP